MSGDTFRGLNKLTEVWLNSNLCINEDFHNLTKIATLQSVVSEKCGFVEVEATTATTTTITAVAIQPEWQIKDHEDSLKQSRVKNARLEAELTATKSQIASLQQNNANLTKENQVLNATCAAQNRLENPQNNCKMQQETITELQADKIKLRSDEQQCISDKQQLNNQLDNIKDLHQTQKLQLTETCAVESKELRENLKFNKQEISELQLDLQISTAQNIQNRNKIANLEKKVELLGGN
jgi:chromosome segregation ATPase